MNNKGKKTNLVAYGQAIIGIAVFVMWILGKITPEAIMAVLIGVNYLGNMLTSKFAKDATASHTFDKFGGPGGHPDPDKEEK